MQKVGHRWFQREEPSRVSCKLWEIQSLPMQLTVGHFGHLSRLTIWHEVTWLLLRLEVLHAASYY